MLPRAMALVSALLLVDATGASAEVFSLEIDPECSMLLIEDVAPLFGPVALSGRLAVEFEPDPLAASTGFRIVELEATAPGGVVVSLDEDAPDAGSGSALLGPSGVGVLSFQTAVLLDTLVVPGFLSGPASLSPPFGGFSADPGGTTVEEAGFQVQFVELGDLRLLSFSVVAVPEPSGARLGGGALAGLVLAAQVRRRSRNRPSTRSRASRVG